MSGSFGRTISGIMHPSSDSANSTPVTLKVLETGLSVEPSDKSSELRQFYWADLSLNYREAGKGTNQWLDVVISSSLGQTVITPDIPSEILSRFERYGSENIKKDTGEMWKSYEESIKRSPFTNCLIFASIVATFICFWSSLTWIEHFIVDTFVPISAGKALGSAYLPQFTKGKADANPYVTRAVNSVGERLIANLGPEDSKNFAKEISFTVVREDNINAFALPGGHIVVFTGLVKACETEDQLAAILAHELSHITHRDGLKAVASQIKWQVLMAFIGGDLGADQKFLFEQVKSLSSLRYSRDVEKRADRDGLLLMHKAGFDIADAGRFFNILASKGETIQDQLNFMSDHPPTKSRITMLNDLSKDLDPIPYYGHDAKSKAQWQKVRNLATH